MPKYISPMSRKPDFITVISIRYRVQRRILPQSIFSIPFALYLTDIEFPTKALARSCHLFRAVQYLIGRQNRNNWMAISSSAKLWWISCSSENSLILTANSNGAPGPSISWTVGEPVIGTTSTYTSGTNRRFNRTSSSQNHLSFIQLWKIHKRILYWLFDFIGVISC